MNTALNKKKITINILASALLAGIIFVVFCALNKIAPFGTYSVMRNDGLHQYAPFLENFVYRIKNGESVLYSQNIGGGINQFALICYYLLSPFNLLALPFNSSNIDIALWLIILVKTMCIAASAGFYFQKKTQTSDIIAVAFSLIYTFGGFYMAYYYNTMWLDALIMLPLIAMGIENIVNGKKATLYFLSLAYAIFVNFYIGYMLCIFAVLYFFYLIFSKDISKNNSEKAEDELPIMQVMTKFGFASVFAGLVCAVSILPVIYAVGKTLGRGHFESEDSFFNILDFLSFHLSGTKPMAIELTEDTAPYVMSSVLTMLTLPAFFFLKNVKPNKKVAAAVIIAIFYFSFSIPKMNAFWHGFSAPNGLPYRFSFLYIFFILTLAYEVVRNLKDVPVWAFGISVVMIIAALIYTKFTEFENHFDKTVIIVSCAALVLYLAFVMLSKYEKLNTKALSVILCVIVVAEIIAGNYASVSSVGKYDDYFNLSTQIKKINEIVEKDGKQTRFEILNQKSPIINNPAMYNYNGLSIFSSLADSSYVATQNMLGNTGNYFSKSIYCNQTPIYNTLFSLGYIYDLDDAISEGNPFYEKVENIDDGTLYKVKYSLPIGYCVDNAVSEWDSDSYLTLLVHSMLWNSVIGQDSSIAMLKSNKIDYVNCHEIGKEEVSQYIQDNVAEVEEDDDHDHDHDHEAEQSAVNDGESLSFNKENLAEILSKIGGLYPFKATAEDFSVSFEFTASEDGENYALVTSGSMQTLTVKSEDGKERVIDISQRHISDLGYFNKGEKFTLTVSNPDRAFEDYDNSLTLTDSIQMSVITLNEESFAKEYNEIVENGTLDVKEYDDTYIYGTVNAKSDCVMMMPMPYDEGWTVYVDGEPVELLEHGSDIMMFKLSAGEHEVEMSYFPLGLREGIFVSVAAILGLVLVLLLSKVHKMKMELVAQEEAAKKEETDEKGKE